MKLSKIRLNKKGEKVTGISVIIKNYDIRIGFLPLGKRCSKSIPLWEVFYYSVNDCGYKHYRFLWFAAGWKRLSR